MKRRETFAVLAALACLIATGPNAVAQEAGSSQNAREAPAFVPLQVDVVLTRFKGEVQTSSLPFSMLVNANDPQGNASVRMGVNVPVPSGPSSFSYQNVGTRIDCRATSSANAFEVFISIDDSSLYEPSEGQSAPGMAGGLPVIRSFASNSRVSIRDGQTMQYTMATDKISGEVMKVTVTVKALK